MTATLPSWAGAGQRLLVVAPHPDDDVIGCGGTLFALVRSGVQPTIVYVTDGSASHPNSIKFPPPKLAALRKCEAREALRELGVRTKPIFLDVPDGTLSELDPSARSHVIERLADVISSLAIDTVFGPWKHDPHPDHVATASVLENA
ncbi:MAG TPA: PIG-L family deacetylase, partial [Candidatus Tumulicola sp.]